MGCSANTLKGTPSDRGSDTSKWRARPLSVGLTPDLLPCGNNRGEDLPNHPFELVEVAMVPHPVAGDFLRPIVLVSFGSR